MAFVADAVGWVDCMREIPSWENDFRFTCEIEKKQTNRLNGELEVPKAGLNWLPCSDSKLAYWKKMVLFFYPDKKQNDFVSPPLSYEAFDLILV